MKTYEKKHLLTESQINRIVNDSVRKALNEGWMEIPEIDDAYNDVLHALWNLEDACNEISEKEIWDAPGRYVDGDERNEPDEFFMPEKDFEKIKQILEKIKNDVSKSRNRNTRDFMRDNGRLFRKG